MILKVLIDMAYIKTLKLYMILNPEGFDRNGYDINNGKKIK